MPPTGSNISNQGELLGAGAQGPSTTSIMGSSAAQGVPGAMLFVNIVVMGAGICSNFVFALGLRGRDKKKKKRIQQQHQEEQGDAAACVQTAELHDDNRRDTDDDGDDCGSTSSSRRVQQFFEFAKFHVYAGVLFPCSSTCGWTHAAASCFHANLSMLFAATVGMYLASGVDSAVTAFAIGAAGPPLALLLVRYLVERLALPCLRREAVSDLAHRMEKYAAVELSPAPLSQTTEPRPNLRMSPFRLPRPASRQASMLPPPLSLAQWSGDGRHHDLASNSSCLHVGNHKDNATAGFFFADEDIDVIDLDALADAVPRAQSPPPPMPIETNAVHNNASFLIADIDLANVLAESSDDPTQQSSTNGAPLSHAPHMASSASRSRSNNHPRHTITIPTT